MTYEEKRWEVRKKLIFSSRTLADVARDAGRAETRSQYQYVWQVVNGVPGSKSEPVLDDLLNELRPNDGRSMHDLIT